MAEIKTVETEELRALLGSGAGVQFWNVLTDEYFHGEMIPGSRRVPLDRVGREAHETALDRGAQVIVYCAGPNCPQSRMAAEKLQALGYTNVRAYEGGIEEWKAAGHGIEQAEQAAAA